MNKKMAADKKEEKITLLGIKHSVVCGYSDIFKMMLQNGLMQSRYVPPKRPSDGRRFIRLYRFAMVGESIVEFAFFKKDSSNLDLDAMSALLDLYLFYTRALYDELMYDMKDLYSDKGNKLPSSFNDFIKKVKKSGYKNVPKFLCELLNEDLINFKKTRIIRNAIKENSALISLVIKEEKIYVRIFGQDKDKKEINLEEELIEFVFGIAFSLWIVMEPELLSYKK